jgi:hypothetical protein
METASRYGIGCGTALVLAGIVELIGLALGWGESNRAIFQVLQILGNIVGSPYLGAGIYVLGGIGLIALGWWIQEGLREKQLAKVRAQSVRAPTAQSLPGHVPTSKVDSYLSFVEQTMSRYGFEPIQFSQDAQAYYKKDFRKSTEYYFVLGRISGTLTPEKVQAISQRTFNYVSKNKQANVLYCYPVMVTENVPAQSQKFIRSYSSKHMSQFEFPVIVDLAAKKLYYYTGTPLWGAAMYSSIRENADLFLGFSKV